MKPKSDMTVTLTFKLCPKGKVSLMRSDGKWVKVKFISTLNELIKQHLSSIFPQQRQ